MPMAIPTTTRIPTCTVLMPMALTSGRNTGERIMIAEEVSMKTPASRMIREIRNMITYLFVEIPNTPLAIASGIL